MEGGRNMYGGYFRRLRYKTKNRKFNRKRNISSPLENCVSFQSLNISIASLRRQAHVTPNAKFSSINNSKKSHQSKEHENVVNRLRF
jgi:hypothetical protein